MDLKIIFRVPVGGKDIGCSAATTKNLGHRGKQDIEITQTQPQLNFLREEDIKCLKKVFFRPIPSNEPLFCTFSKIFALFWPFRAIFDLRWG